MTAQGKPRLYHAPSSYFSMIARLALAEGGIDCERIFVDIHFRGSQQLPPYARLNLHMTVPTLVLPDRVLDESRDILGFALGARGEDAETGRWVDLHYSYPIEELTIGGLFARSRLAAFMIPRKIASVRPRLLRMAAAHPELAQAYEARAAVFAERERIFDPKTAAHLSAVRRDQAIQLLDKLEDHFRDRREVMVPPGYGAADVVWTVFLARMEFVGMAAEVAGRPSLARYWGMMKARPSFANADIWTKLHLGRLIRGVMRG